MLRFEDECSFSLNVIRTIIDLCIKYYGDSSRSQVGAPKESKGHQTCNIESIWKIKLTPWESKSINIYLMTEEAVFLKSQTEAIKQKKKKKNCFNDPQQINSICNAQSFIL